jgi:hypothetical protein
MSRECKQVATLPRWLSFAFVDQFASNLLVEAAPLLPAPDIVVEKVKKAAKLKERQDMALTTLHRRAVEFGRREKLNFLQKARLSKQLQDGLIRHGQSAEFAKDFAVRVIADLR